MDLLESHGIAPAYDVALIASAAGEPEPNNGGMSVLLLDRASQTTKEILGCVTGMPVAFMDFLAIITGLQYHHDHIRQDERLVRVLIITSNRQLADNANVDHTSREWALFDWFSRHGYTIDWLWESSATTRHQDAIKKAQVARRGARDLSTWAPVSA